MPAALRKRGRWDQDSGEDLAALVDVEQEVRHSRTIACGEKPEFLAEWHQIWHHVSAYYCEHICPPESFDPVINNSAEASSG